MIRLSCSKADITPDRPVSLAGYAGRTGPSSGVESRLEANIAVFEDASGRKAAIVAIDCLFAGHELENRILGRAAEHGLKQQDVLVFASHTHYAPQFDDDLKRLGAFDSAAFENASATILAALDRAITGPVADITIRTSSGPIEGAIHRRRRSTWPRLSRHGLKLGGVLFAPNPEGQIDHAGSVVVLESRQGTPLAILWRWTCHPTNQPDPSALSADFPGVVREHLRKTFSADLPCLFLQGFAGDVRADTSDHRPSLGHWCRNMVFGPSFPANTPQSYRAWTAKIATGVAALAATASQRRNEGEIASAITSVAGSQVLPRTPGLPAIAFRRLRLGSIADIVAVAAEPVSGLQDLIGLAGAWACGYLGGVFGYWPTETQIGEGGYESHDMLAYFDLTGPFAKDSDTLFASAVRELRSLS